MSWTDKKAMQTINKLRDEFGIRFFVETGTFCGINALVQSKNFEYILTCEKEQKYLDIAAPKLDKAYNVYLYKAHSPVFLKEIKDNKIIKTPEMLFVYLDAHFYDPSLPKDKRFVVIDELKALTNMTNCIICIHDFDNKELGHITYDDIPLDFDLLKHYLFDVNPNFKYYTNYKEACEIYNEATIKELIDDKDADGNIKYANSSDEKRFRGILYCVPKELDLSKYELRELK